jgi:hypothetical protein
MIYEHLLHGEYVYTVTDSKGNQIAETYDLFEAEHILAEYRTRLHTEQFNDNLYRGVYPEPKR